MKKRVNITIQDHLLDKVDEMAKQRGVDRSTMISLLIFDASELIESRDEYGLDASYVRACVKYMGDI